MNEVWNLHCHDGRQLTEISESLFQPSGIFWPDLQNLIQILGAKIHPCFKPLSKKQENRFVAISYKFDDFSLGILCKAITNSATKHLGFSNTALSESNITQLINLIKQSDIKILQIDWNPIENPDLFGEFLKSPSKLQNLSLKSSGIHIQAFNCLCENLKVNKSLQTLDLYGNNITNLTALASLLETNRSLASINLSGNQLTDEHLAPLVGVFGKIPYSEEQVKEFKSLEKIKAKMKIQSLPAHSFSNEDFSDEIFYEEERKEYFLLKNQIFRHLNLSLNNFTNDHYLRLILSIALKDLKILLSGNPLPESLKTSLLQAFNLNLFIN